MVETATPVAPHIFGIRHHGPGSARSLRQALEALQPDIILVEGPPDATDMLPFLIHEEMKPPVALLVYVPDAPKRSVYYPFAIFSPEWQALTFGLTRKIPVRFMDLPQAHQLIAPSSDEEKGEEDITAKEAPPIVDPPQPADEKDPLPNPRRDPLGWLGEAAGYTDGERWWEHMVEHRSDGTDLFEAILEAMTALRENVPPVTDPLEIEREARREAYMRQTIRTAQREGFQRIAVVCGAWHGPALANMPAAAEDEAILKDLPRVKVAATWVPWTYGRLAYNSGYGAGIESPGWYDHLWTAPDLPVVRWLVRVAALLRAEDLDASSAHVIETVRLAEALASLRGRALPDLSELSEAIRAVLCSGDDTQLKLIHDKLIVGEILGEVPDETPMVPLQHDLIRQQKRLRLTVDAVKRPLELDLRKPNDRERSFLLHRLTLLGVPWGEREKVTGKSSTFHENWRLQWQPEFVVLLIEAGIWGNTVSDAAAAFTVDKANKATILPELTRLVGDALLADLPEAVEHLIARMQAAAALASDIGHLMEALPPLANVLRYGNVRQTDAGMVGQIIDGLVVRICIGLPGACSSLNDDAATVMFDHVVAVNAALALLQNQENLNAWYDVLKHMVDQPGIHGLLAGRYCRLLLEASSMPAEEAARRMSFALSIASEPAQAAAWIEGFLKGSGLLLLHDNILWQVIDAWVSSLSPDAFTQVLPLLRRTFSTFAAPERRQMGERVRSGLQARPLLNREPVAEVDFDPVRAESVLPLLRQLLGIK